MTRFVPKHSKKAGTRPGTVAYVGRKREHSVAIDVIEYDAHHIAERRVHSLPECLPLKPAPAVTWLRLNGIHDPRLIEQIGAHFNIHPLTQEDIANTAVRPVLEESPALVSIILKRLSLDGGGLLHPEQAAVIFSRHLVISFQERDSGPFDAVRDRLRSTVPRTRFLETDYLAYSLADALIDDYFVTMDRLGEQLDAAQDELVRRPTPDHLETIFALRRELLLFRKALWPLREVIAALARSENRLIHDDTRPYIRDLYEHTVQALDTIETMRDMAASLLEIYLSSVSNRMNEVMKVLTIIGTVFLPLGFLAGVYGMNFDRTAGRLNMPELGFPYGYIVFWVLVLLVVAAFVLFFRRRKWI